MRRKFTCYRCGKYVEAEMDTDGDATCPACENVIGLEPERKLQNRIASLELQLSEARARLAWIPVDERLPEDRATILAAFKNREILTATYYKRYEGFGGVDNFWEIAGWHSGDVTHWMPLPQPPKVEGCEDVHLDCKIAKLEKEIDRLKEDLAETQACLLERNIELDVERRSHRWIPVSERLPEDGEVVWLWDGNKLGMGYYLVFSGCFMDRDAPLRRIKPTHWMSLPTPPEVEK